MLYMVTIVNHVLTWINPKSLQMVTASHLVKAMVVPVVMYGCESCTTKKAEHPIIDAFELWC